ncbi:MAG: thioredoxin-like domain-containing protein [Candidatus Dadabacteria bacterium]
MKRLFFIFLLIPALIFAQGNGFVLTGNIAGLPDGEIKLTNSQNQQVLTTGTSKGGVFTLKGSVNEPGLYWLNIGKEQQYIFIENSQMKVTGSEKDLKNLKIEGSSSHKDFEDFKRIFDPLIGNLNTVAAQLQQAPENRKEALMNQYQNSISELNRQVTLFVSTKKKSYVSPFLLFVTAQVSENINELEKRFNIIDEQVRNSETGKSLANYISYMKVGSIGTEALNFTQSDPNNKPVSLSSFKGKYVLVDFWASWCKPCRMENPNVVKAFNKFKSKNFTILSVSLDQAKDKWLDAIKQDNLNWTHVSDLQQWNNSVAVMYHITSIPQNFLVDPNGKIVAKDLRGEELEKALCQYLGCN